MSLKHIKVDSAAQTHQQAQNKNGFGKEDFSYTLHYTLRFEMRKMLTYQDK